MERSPLADACEVLRRYGFTVDGGRAFVRQGGGFSGADVWQVATAAGPCCLRCWPEESPGYDRVVWIHTLLRRAHGLGCRFLPLPLKTADEATVVDHGGRLWELTNWLDGRADESPRLSEPRLEVVMQALAKFHLALASEPYAAVATAPSPGLVDRLHRLDDGLTGACHDLRRADVPFNRHAWAARREEYLSLYPRAAAIARPVVAEAAERLLRLQPCIRDLRRDHLLFVDDRLTGLVDFGAVQMDHPSIDTARAVAECAGDDEPRRVGALAVYRSAVGARFADAVDPTLIAAFDRSNVLLSPGNWLRWVLVEERRFADEAAALRRFDALMVRLRRVAETL